MSAVGDLFAAHCKTVEASKIRGIFPNISETLLTESLRTLRRAENVPNLKKAAEGRVRRARGQK